MACVPRYLALYESGELDRRIKQVLSFLESCTLCPRECKINRLKGKVGVCGAGSDLVVSSVSPHFGEERPLVGHGGSGTIFLAHCNLKCVFCQNYNISHLAQGEKISSEELATHMVTLQQTGCHNINFVTPTHVVPQLLTAMPKAIERGLHLPLVYNCGGYESLEVIKLLDGIIDIYMPDAKFADSAEARKYCKATDYPEVNKQVLKEMHRQTGVLKINRQGVAERGLLIRHLVMPGRVAGSEKILRFIAEALSTESYVNIMAQYYPQFEAAYYPELNRRITPQEYHEVIVLARSFGLHRGFPDR